MSHESCIIVHSAFSIQPVIIAKTMLLNDWMIQWTWLPRPPFILITTFTGTRPICDFAVISILENPDMMLILTRLVVLIGGFRFVDSGKYTVYGYGFEIEIEFGATESSGLSNRLPQPEPFVDFKVWSWRVWELEMDLYMFAKSNVNFEVMTLILRIWTWTWTLVYYGFQFQNKCSIPNLRVSDTDTVAVFVFSVLVLRDLML